MLQLWPQQPRRHFWMAVTGIEPWTAAREASLRPIPCWPPRPQPLRPPVLEATTLAKVQWARHLGIIWPPKGPPSQAKFTPSFFQVGPIILILTVSEISKFDKCHAIFNNAPLKKGPISASFWALFKNATFELSQNSSFVALNMLKHTRTRNFARFCGLDSILQTCIIVKFAS